MLPFAGLCLRWTGFAHGRPCGPALLGIAWVCMGEGRWGQACIAARRSETQCCSFALGPMLSWYHPHSNAAPAQMRMRTVEELVGALGEDEWHNLPRWKRIPSLEAGESGGGRGGAVLGRAWMAMPWGERLPSSQHGQAATRLCTSAPKCCCWQASKRCCLLPAYLLPPGCTLPLLLRSDSGALQGRHAARHLVHLLPARLRPGGAPAGAARRAADQCRG